MLALDPVAVRLDAAERGDVRPVSQLMPLLRERGDGPAARESGHPVTAGAKAR
jgi:hypothetical protein